MTSRQTSQPNMLSGVVVIRPEPDPFPRGGRDSPDRRSPTGACPSGLPMTVPKERYVSLTTTRLHATTVYVVAEVDGTGRLTDPRLTVTPDLARARRAANAAVARWGGVAEEEGA